MVEFKHILNIEYALLFIIMISTLVTTYFLDKYKKKKDHIIQILENTFSKMITNQVIDLDNMVEKKHLNIRYILPVIESINNKVKDSHWRQIQSNLIHVYLKKQLDKLINSFYWHDQLLAIRMLQIAPDHFYQTFIEKMFNNKNKLLRLEAIKAGILLEDPKLILSILQLMTKSNLKLQYIYRDPLEKSSDVVHQMIKEVFLETNDQGLQVSCLKILSLKYGYLSLEELKPFIASDDLKVKWWSLRALENLPSEETTILIHELLQKEDNWLILSLLLYLIYAQKNLHLMEDAVGFLSHNHYWVTFVCILTLSSFEAKGLQALKENQTKTSSYGQKWIEYMLDPSSKIQFDLQYYFPINHNPEHLIKALDL